VRFGHDVVHHHPPFGLMKQTNVMRAKEFRQAAERFPIRLRIIEKGHRRRATS
jgi:hypothetical protein